MFLAFLYKPDYIKIFGRLKLNEKGWVCGHVFTKPGMGVEYVPVFTPTVTFTNVALTKKPFSLE